MDTLPIYDRSSLPLLFLDVDGPLNPWAAKPHRRPAGYQTFRYPRLRERDLRVWLNPAHGAQLLELPLELVWATAWDDEANSWVAPKIGLPELPVVHVGQPIMDMTLPPHLRSAQFNLSHKIPQLVTFAAGRPFAWIDDEIGRHDDDYVASHHSAPTLLQYVSPQLGLLESDFKTLKTWAEEVLSAGSCSWARCCASVTTDEVADEPG